jgi:adenylate cyclase
VASTRRLSAIMFTDMVGSTAAAQANEAEALSLRNEQVALLRPLFAAHQGREIKTMGDGFLAEFDSALRATECAVDIQRRIHERNAQKEVVPLRVRIGIHLGDVEQQGTDILGDAVNIASRIEPVAEPGGICVSNAVREQVWNKIQDPLEKLAPTALKGLRFPMEIYRVVLPWTAPGSPSPLSGPTGLAILPFKNISPDPQDGYFAEGLTEELITVISQLRGLRVISRTSVMQYQANTKPIAQVGAELGVSSVLEGSVRKAGNRLRITAQLIDAHSDQHIWAKSYDRELDDVFAVQSEIARQVAEALAVELRPAEEARLDSRPAVRSDSYLAYVKGRTLMHDYSREAKEAAREQFELATSLDPMNAAAYAGLADVVRILGWWNARGPRSAWDPEGRRAAARAIELDPNLADAHASLGLILWDSYEWAAAEKEFKLAVSLNPSFSLAHHWYANLLEDLGRGEDALTEFLLAEGADPLWPENLVALSNLLSWLGRSEEALAKVEKLAKVAPDYHEYPATLAFYYMSRSDLANCVKQLQRMVELLPDKRFESILRAFTHVIAGEPQQGRDLIERVVEDPGARPFAWNIAWVYAELRDLDGCFRWMEIALADHHLPLQVVRLYPGLAPVRADPRFTEILNRMKLA